MKHRIRWEMLVLCDSIIESRDTSEEITATLQRYIGNQLEEVMTRFTFKKTSSQHRVVSVEPFDPKDRKEAP